MIELLANVAIVVEDEPHSGDEDLDASEPASVFGFYEGTPHLERGHAYGMALPDKITIFRGPHERDCGDLSDLRSEVRMTLVHELAHHMGFDEAQIEKLGWS